MFPESARAQLGLELVAGGLREPVAFAQNPADARMQLIGEHTGAIRVLFDGALLDRPFLDLTADVTHQGERGLLGLVFSLDYGTTGRVYVSFTDVNGHTIVSRFVRSAETPFEADPASRFYLRWQGGDAGLVPTSAYHLGGHMAFGSDGYLYVGFGDGGWRDDPDHLAQNPQSLLGKILRIDVSVPDEDAQGYRVPDGNPFVGTDGVLPEIWAFGLRNPWRFSFDDPARGGSGALVIGDVGQDSWEEINWVPAQVGGRNFGWRVREGAGDYITTEPPFGEWLTDPLYTYDHVEGRSVIGGYVYRGARLRSAMGRYFFADFVSGRVMSAGLAIAENGEATVTDVSNHGSDLGAVNNVSSFGVDASGELYVLSYSNGAVYRIVPGTRRPPANPSTPTGCPGKDPFAEIGGGICLNGEWLPAGLAPPSPVAPLPSEPSPATCASPDPFTILGGGRCINGEWLPPDDTSAPAPLPPSPPPSESPTTPPPTGAPSAPVSSCMTPDPFASIGGGTCYGGEWLPPGYPVPSAPPPSTPAPPPTTPPAGGCATPDPFVILGGGTCRNGEWLPPGM